MIHRTDRYRDSDTGAFPMSLCRSSTWGVVECIEHEKRFGIPTGMVNRSYRLVQFLECGTTRYYHTYFGDIQQAKAFLEGKE